MIIFLTLTLGIPTVIVSLVIFFAFEHVPLRGARLFLPAGGAMLMLAVILLVFTGYPPAEPYGQIAFLMMVTSFVLNALVILAPFPFFRRFLGTNSPYLILCFTVFATVFLLTSFGFIGGEIKMPVDAAEYERNLGMRTMSVVVAEVVTAALIYTCLAARGIVANKGIGSGD